MRRRTSVEWIEYYRANLPAWDHVDWQAPAWDDRPGASLADCLPLIRSLQAWQLGETSEAKQLKAAAKRYAFASGDYDFIEAMDYFIREEQRHGEALGRFLDAAGAERLRRDWGDSLFRFARHSLATIEMWTTVVVMIETLAMVYYAAVRRAMPSPLCRAICTQILRDEVPHLRFQTERLASFYDERRPWLYKLTMLGHRVLFAVMATTVWIAHRRMFTAGGHTLRTYWSQAWRRMARGWQAMEPRRAWLSAHEVVVLRRRFQSRSSRREAPSRLEGWLH